MRNAFYLIVTVISAAALFMLAQIAINHFNADSDEDFATVVTHHDLSFQVHYVNNNMFEENPIPQNFNFLMSFTDYILVNDRFNISVGQATNIYYDFTVYKRLVVTSPDSGDNLIVFEQSSILDEGNGQSHGTHVQISSTGDFLDENNGFAVSPRDYIFWYRQFTEYHQQQMNRENVSGLSTGRNLSAELRIDFLYNIHLPEFNHRESSTRGFVIPLGEEIYNLTASGSPTNESRLSLANNASAPPVFAFVSGVLICLAALVWSFIMFIKDDKNEGIYQKSQIIKKYSDNLVIANSSIDLSNSTIVTVRDFKEMLKLSAWLNKPIIYCIETSDADFVLAAEDFTYIYNISPKQQILPIEKTIEVNEAEYEIYEEYKEAEIQTPPIEFEKHLKKKRENESNRNTPIWMQRVGAAEGNTFEAEENTFEDIFIEEAAPTSWNVENSANVMRAKKSRFGYSKLI